MYTENVLPTHTEKFNQSLTTWKELEMTRLSEIKLGTILLIQNVEKLILEVESKMVVTRDWEKQRGGKEEKGCLMGTKLQLNKALVYHCTVG